MFWNSTHRKIVEVLEVDREVNNPKRNEKYSSRKTEKAIRKNFCY